MQVIDNLSMAVKVVDATKQGKARARLGAQCCTWLSLAYMALFAQPTGTEADMRAAGEWGEESDERTPKRLENVSCVIWSVQNDLQVRIMYCHSKDATKAELSKAHAACERSQV